MKQNVRLAQNSVGSCGNHPRSCLRPREVGSRPPLDRNTLYPVKSLAGLDVSEAQVNCTAALQNDRRFALIDAQGMVINAKHTPLIHAIRSFYDLIKRLLTLSSPDQGAPFLSSSQPRSRGSLSQALELIRLPPVDRRKP